MSNVLIVGRIWNNIVSTPKRQNVKFVGGSGYFAALSASFFAQPVLVSRTGNDLPERSLETLAEKEVDLTHVETVNQKANVWRAQYQDLAQHETLAIELELDDDIKTLPAEVRQTPFLFVTEMHPNVQEALISQSNASQVMLDTKISWVKKQPDALKEVLQLPTIVMMNNSEAEHLFGNSHPQDNLEAIRKLGPETAIINLGPEGSILSKGELTVRMPVIISNPVETTGGGDTFGGGFIGALASGMTTAEAFLHGQVMSSFVVEDFGANRILQVSPDQVEQRVEKSRSLLAEKI